jgi:hypothetical protein
MRIKFVACVRSRRSAAFPSKTGKLLEEKKLKNFTSMCTLYAFMHICLCVLI